jgi:DNA-binding winged helix-turn-helix (wHTH) protein
MILDFAPFTLDTGRAELRNGDAVVALEPKVYALLRLLVENHDRVVSRDEMIAVVWGGRFISDAAVSTALKQVRRALGDDGAAQVFIRTLHGMGHRFVAPVRIRAAAAAASQPESTVTADAPGGPPTIAVLPFGAAGLPDNFASLGDALPAEIISALSRLRWLRVSPAPPPMVIVLADWKRRASYSAVSGACSRRNCVGAGGVQDYWGLTA